MQQLRGPGDRGAVRDGDRLVSEADPEDRDSGRPNSRDDGDADPASSGMPGPGESSTPSIAAASSSVDLVVAQHLALGTQLREVLHQVEDERVVVVDDEDATLTASSLGQVRAAAPARTSDSSTVTSVKGSRGSIQGKTHRKSTTTTAAKSRRAIMIRTSIGPGR